MAFPNRKRVYSSDEISLSMIPLDEKDLMELHGPSGNIFVKHPGVYPPKRIVTIYCEIRSKKNISFDYNNIFLIDAKGKPYGSVSRKDLFSLWKEKLPTSRKEGLARLIDSTVLPEKVILTEKRGFTSGYMVFIVRNDSSGQFFLAVPPSATGGGMDIMLLPIEL